MKQTYKHAWLALILLMNFWSYPVRADHLPAARDFATDAREAHKNQLPILVLFMSSSCHYCEIVLEDFLLPMQRDPEFKNRVILRQIETGSNARLIDFEGKATTHSAFSGRYKVWGVPQVFLFDSTGKVLGKIEGLLTVDYYYAYLDNAITDALQKIRSAKKP